MKAKTIQTIASFLATAVLIVGLSDFYFEFSKGLLIKWYSSLWFPVTIITLLVFSFFFFSVKED